MCIYLCICLSISLYLYQEKGRGGVGMDRCTHMSMCMCLSICMHTIVSTHLPHIDRPCVDFFIKHSYGKHDGGKEGTGFFLTTASGYNKNILNNPLTMPQPKPNP